MMRQRRADAGSGALCQTMALGNFLSLPQAWASLGVGATAPSLSHSHQTLVASLPDCQVQGGVSQVILGVHIRSSIQ